MRYCFLWCLLIGLWLPVIGRAQGCTESARPIDCPGPAPIIRAFKSGTNTEVNAFCVGSDFRFTVCNFPVSNISLEALPGTVTSFSNCNGSKSGSYEYPARAPGTVTIYANVNDTQGNSLFFSRVFQIYDSPASDFEVKGCLNGNVLITVKPGPSYDRYVANFDNGPQQVPLAPGSTSVVASGSSTGVTVVGFYSDNTLCSNSSHKDFTIPPTAAPLRFVRLTQAPQAGGGATVTLENLQAGYQYSITREDASGPGGVSTVLPILPTTTGNVTLTLPGVTQGRYQLHRVDACQLQPDDSPPIYTLDLRPVTEAPGQNNLSFTYAGPAPTSFYIERNGTRLPATIPGAATSYSDTDVLCGTRYTYRVVAVLPNGAESVSNVESATARPSGLAPPVPPLVASFTLNNTVSLTPVLSSQGVPRGSVLLYSKTSGNRSFPNFARDTTGRPILDPALFDSLRLAPPCYTVQFQDRCAILSLPSAPTCPAFLTATAADPEGNTVTLSWTNFTGPDPAAPTTYELLRLAPDGSILSTLPVSGRTATDLTPPADRQVLRYRLRISGGGIPANTVSYSNVATVARRVRLQMPTAFTPDGNGLNDLLEVKGRFLANYSLVVVDRNGVEVFRSTQRSETWDGRINGHAPVNGTYVWRFQQIDETGKMVRETGTITILQ